MSDSDVAEAMNLSLATTSDVPAIVDLLNLTYRSDVGWTNEHALVGGHRVTFDQVMQIVAGPEADFLIYVQNNCLVSCIRLAVANGVAELGMFAVVPDLQGSGIGSRVIAAAEHYARQNYAASKFVMSVLAPRAELIAYYERRGYQRTGRVMPFPVDENVGSPKVTGLMLEELEKTA